MSWSGGKDACAALALLRRDGATEVHGLLTTFAPDPDRVAFQRGPCGADPAASGGAWPPADRDAGSRRRLQCRVRGRALRRIKPWRDKGVDTLAYGDLHLDDIRAYRDGVADRMGMRAIYPVWGRDTAAFARSVIALGIRALVCSVDPTRLPLVFAGRQYDEAFLADLPQSVDPCGEAGEFHTFVYDAPGYAHPVLFERSAPTMRGSVGYCPLMAA